jgi:hypothetical protein
MPPRKRAPTTADEATTDAAALTTNITCRGRKLIVKVPRPEQRSIWLRTAQRLNDIGPSLEAVKDTVERTRIAAESAHDGAKVAAERDYANARDELSALAEQISPLVDRAIRVIQSVLVLQADRDWVEDLILGDATLEQLSEEIIGQAVKAFQALPGATVEPEPAEPGPRAVRR